MALKLQTGDSTLLQNGTDALILQDLVALTAVSVEASAEVSTPTFFQPVDGVRETEASDIRACGWR